MTGIVARGMLDEELDAVVKAGGYESPSDALVDALDALLVANPELRRSTAVELYRQGEVTLSRAAEIAGLDFSSFKDELTRRNVPIIVETSPEELRAGEEIMRRLWSHK